jgi:hypothetical protein
MIHAIACLLFPLLGGCSPYVDYAAGPSNLLLRPGYYAGHPVIVTGKVDRLRALRGASFGTAAETFYLCDGKCVQVFMREHTPMFEGERVSVRGFFSERQRIGSLLLRDNIEASEIFPRV